MKKNQDLIITLKMKFSFVFLLLLDFSHLNGELSIKENEQFLLRLNFDPYYKSSTKSCCKLFPGQCFLLMDSTGYIYWTLRGRVTKTESDSGIEFKISNARLEDAGSYRCFVDRTWIDYVVKVSESSIHQRSYQPPLTTTIKALAPSTSLRPHSTGPVPSRDHGNHSVFGSFGTPLLIAVFTITVVLVIALVIGVVCRRVKAKRERLDKCGETLCESQRHDAGETSGIVYSTVDFRPHQESTKVYANLRIPKTQAVAPDPAAHTEMVEYSTLAIHQ